MKVFFHKYGDGIIRMFVNQFAISLFGSTLAMATLAAKNDTLTILVSIGSIIFYLFLLYIMTWDIGAKDRVSVDIGKKEYRPLTGLIMSVIANIPTFILALLFILASVTASDTLGAIVNVARIIIEGMFVGIMSIVKIGGTQLHNIWWVYFAITLPAIVTCSLSYFLGHKNFRFTSWFNYKDPNKK